MTSLGFRTRSPASVADRAASSVAERMGKRPISLRQVDGDEGLDHDTRMHSQE
jgi:hypothetical protein